MGKINTQRVVIGGLLAGLIINISEFILNMMVIGEDMNAAMARLNLPPVGGNAIIVFVAFGFIVGILTVWLYAAIRPRFGAGPKTALIAAAFVWFMAYFYGSIGMGVMGIFPSQLLAIGMVWGLVELLIAGVAGAYLYQESTPTGRAAAV